MKHRRNALYILLSFLLLGGLFTGKQVMFSMAYAVMGVFVLSLLWAWSTIRAVEIRRKTNTRRGQVGQLFGEEFFIRNRSLLPKLWLEIEDHSTLPGYYASRVIPAMRPQETVHWTASTQCMLRGEFQLGPITLSSSDPFGLFRFSRDITAISRLIVYPAVVPLTSFAAPGGMLSGGDAQRQRTHVVTTNAAGIREYAPGDSYNRIHWRSTARKNRLLVKEFELDPLADVWIFLDLSASSQVEQPGLHQHHILASQPGRGNTSNGHDFPLLASTEEYGVVIAASIARYFIEKGRSVGFATYGPQREILQSDRTHRQLNHLLEILAVVKGTGDFDLEHMLTLNTEYLSRGTTLVLITPDTTQAWIRHAHTLTQRGIKPVVVLLDPASFGGHGDVMQIRAQLATFHTPTYVIRAGDNLSAALRQPLF